MSWSTQSIERRTLAASSSWLRMQQKSSKKCKIFVTQESFSKLYSSSAKKAVIHSHSLPYLQRLRLPKKSKKDSWALSKSSSWAKCSNYLPESSFRSMTCWYFPGCLHKTLPWLSQHGMNSELLLSADSMWGASICSLGLAKNWALRQKSALEARLTSGMRC